MLIDTVAEPPPCVRDARRLSDHHEDGVDATWCLARRFDGVAATCGRVDGVEALRRRVDVFYEDRVAFMTLRRHLLRLFILLVTFIFLIFLIFRLGLLLDLVLLQYISSKLVLHVAHFSSTTGQAVVVDYFTFDLVGRLR